jgi:hypothetical protein
MLPVTYPFAVLSNRVLCLALRLRLDAHERVSLPALGRLPDSLLRVFPVRIVALDLVPNNNNTNKVSGLRL